MKQVVFYVISIITLCIIIFSGRASAADSSVAVSATVPYFLTVSFSQNQFRAETNNQNGLDLWSSKDNSKQISSAGSVSLPVQDGGNVTCTGLY